MAAVPRHDSSRSSVIRRSPRTPMATDRSPSLVELPSRPSTCVRNACVARPTALGSPLRRISVLRSSWSSSRLGRRLADRVAVSQTAGAGIRLVGSWFRSRCARQTDWSNRIRFSPGPSFYPPHCRQCAYAVDRATPGRSATSGNVSGLGTLTSTIAKASARNSLRSAVPKRPVISSIVASSRGPIPVMSSYCVGRRWRRCSARCHPPPRAPCRSWQTSPEHTSRRN